MHVICPKYYKSKYKTKTLNLNWLKTVNLKMTFKTIATKSQTASKIAKILAVLI